MGLETKPRGIERGSRDLRWPLAAVLMVLFLVLLAGFIFYRLETWPQRTAAASFAKLERVGGDARDKFIQLAHLQPRITINDRVYLEQTSTVADLSVIADKIQVEHEMLHTWAGSTKRIRLHGTFLVKAGFDLRKRFAVTIRPDQVTIELPHAEILSVQQEEIEVLAFENGFWNRISPADIEKELAVLPERAREKSAQLPDKAEEVFTGELREKFHPPQPVRVIFPAPSPRG